MSAMSDPLMWQQFQWKFQYNGRWRAPLFHVPLFADASPYLSGGGCSCKRNSWLNEEVVGIWMRCSFRFPFYSIWVISGSSFKTFELYEAMNDFLCDHKINFYLLFLYLNNFICKKIFHSEYKKRKSQFFVLISEIFDLLNFGFFSYQICSKKCEFI